MSNVILHLCDWNMQDKYYEAPIDLVRQFGLDIKDKGIRDAWGLFKRNIDFDDDGSKPVKCATVNMNLDVYFMDWDAPNDCCTSESRTSCLEDWEETGIFEAKGEKASDVAKE